MAYLIYIERSAQKSLSKISNPYQKKIITAINKLADAPRPRGAKKLSGRPAWRIRIGTYRVIYEIHDDVLTVLIVAIGLRGGIYR